MTDTPQNKEVMPAQHPLSGTLGSFGNASYRLDRQQDFPHTYSELDELIGWDHDRIMQHNPSARAICDKYLKTGEMYIPTWVKDNLPENVIKFFAAMLQVEDKEWTGFRLLTSINRSNGYPVFTLELFRKHPDSDTEVYSGVNAPNVTQPTLTDMKSAHRFGVSIT